MTLSDWLPENQAWEMCNNNGDNELLRTKKAEANWLVQHGSFCWKVIRQQLAKRWSDRTTPGWKTTTKMFDKNYHCLCRQNHALIEWSRICQTKNNQISETKTTLLQTNRYREEKFCLAWSGHCRRHIGHAHGQKQISLAKRLTAPRNMPWRGD